MFLTREKKVIDLCKSQQKVYNTFTDELSDYIQIQKARGITPRPPVLPPGDSQNEDDEDEEEEVLCEEDSIELNKPLPNFPPTYTPPHHSRLDYNPIEGCPPPYQAPPWPSHSLDYNRPPPVLPDSGSPLFNSQPIISRRRRKPSSSSSYITSSSYSSSYSSYSSSTSDSDDNEYRRREKRRIRRSRRDKRPKNEDSAKEEKRNKQGKRERQKESEERRRGEPRGSEEERRRKKRKSYGKWRRQEKKSRVEDFEAVGGERVMDILKPEGTLYNRKETEVVHIEAKMNVEQGDGGQDEPIRPKCRKEKKKPKEKVGKLDTRTEEEKLWDDSILGF